MQEVEYMQQALKIAPIAMAIHTGPDMKIAFANELMLQAWGKDAGVLGKPFVEGLPELAEFAFEKKMAEVFESGIPFTEEQIRLMYVHNEAVKTFYYNYGFSPLKDAEGKIYGILNFARDVTAEVTGRNAEKKLLENEALLSREQRLNEQLLEYQQSLEALNNELETRVSNRTAALTISENRFRAVIEQAPVAIIVFRGEEMMIDAVNLPMLHLLGRNKEISGKPLLSAIPELAGQGPHALLYKIYTTGEPVYGFEEPVVLNRSGKKETGYYNFSYTPLIEEGKITGVVDMAIEVTDQVKARQAVQVLNNELMAINSRLAESEANLRLTIEAANFGVWHYDIDTGKLHVDERCRELYGLPMEREIFVKDVQDPADPEYLPLLQATLKNAVEKNLPCDIQHPITHLITKEHRWLRVIGKIKKNENGHSRFYGVTMDITEQKKDEQRKNDFISMVSHELKTPLTSLSGYIQILQMKTARKNSMEESLLDKSYHQVKRMTTMINGFLNMSRLESGKIQVDKSDFLLDDLIQEMIDEAAMVQPLHQVFFHRCSPLKVHADRDKIGNVISNLLSNAIKYSPDNKNIDISCKQEGNTVQVSVQDRGMGIRPEDVERLFERYYRVEGNPNISGFGIGLYLSAEIIQRHHGRIWVESHPGTGSIFYFNLPIQ